jgi:hypothetical protein
VKFKISKDTDGLINHFYPILPYKVMFKYLDTGDKSTCLMNNRINKLYDIGMSFGIDKCKMQSICRGHYEHLEYTGASA